MANGDDNARTLPSGAILHLDRPRSEGPLTADELAFCVKTNVPLSYDPLQSGWVPAQAVDDLCIKEIDHPHFPKRPGARPRISLHLAFRHWHVADLPRFVALLDDPRMWDHMPEPYPDPLTPDLAASLIEIANAGAHHDVQAVLFDDAPVGQMRLQFGVDRDDPAIAELSYWIGQDHWGRGIASAAVASFVRQAFAEHPQVTSLVARVRPQNRASLRVLEKAGFRLEPGLDNAGWHILRKPRPGRAR